MHFESIVVGGGMAGMSCAAKLKEAGRDVAIIADELGGRTCYDPETDNNFGAVFYMENYENARKILTPKSPLQIGLGQLMLFSSAGKSFKGTSLTMAASLPQFVKFKRFMERRFMPEYAAYKKDCETNPVDIAMLKHPVIERLYRLRANEFIAELGIGRIADNFVSKFAYGCTGSRIADLNALDFLNVSQGVVVPIYDFTFDAQAFTRKLEGKVLVDTVMAVERNGHGWLVRTTSGDVHDCRYLVVATPARVAKELLGTGEIRTPTLLASYLCEGTPRDKYNRATANYFSDEYDIIALAKRPDGRINVYARADIDLSPYIQDLKVVKKRIWPDALYVYGDAILKQDWAENCWIAGDHNGLGMEPAAISGIYAANRILGLA